MLPWPLPRSIRNGRNSEATAIWALAPDRSFDCRLWRYSLTHEIDNPMQNAANHDSAENSLAGGLRPAAVDFTLPQVLDMRAARDFKRSLEQVYTLGRPCVVDAQEVTRISTGCIQVFFAFARAMSDSGQTLTLRQPSPALLECVQQLGLFEFFDLCTVEH